MTTAFVCGCDYRITPNGVEWHWCAQHQKAKAGKQEDQGLDGWHNGTGNLSISKRHQQKITEALKHD